LLICNDEEEKGAWTEKSESLKPTRSSGKKRQNKKKKKNEKKQPSLRGFKSNCPNE
jgi:hypothetical protein